MTAFDMHHLDLRRALHLPDPEDTAAERLANQELETLMRRSSTAVNLAYQQPGHE